MPSTDVQVGTLTADDLAALRIAETVSFHVHQGAVYIRASIDVNRNGEPRIFTAREQRVLVQADDWRRCRDIVTGGGAHGYDGDSSWRGDESTSAFEMVHSARYSDTWKTIVSLLKVGDEIRLDFCGDGGSNGYVKSANLHVDTLHLDVRRGDQRFRFLVDFSVCPNNSARAVKRFG